MSLPTAPPDEGSMSNSDRDVYDREGEHDDRGDDHDDETTGDGSFDSAGPHVRVGSRPTDDGADDLGGDL